MNLVLVAISAGVIGGIVLGFTIWGIVEIQERMRK